MDLSYLVSRNVLSTLACRLYCRQLFSASQRSQTQYDYDLLVIGGGSGGLACAKQASLYDKKVAVLDYVNPSPQGSKWGLGGTCVNVGCIPKKLMHQAALLGRAIKDSKSYGWHLTNESSQDNINNLSVKHNWSTLKDAINNHIRSLNWGYRVQLNQKTIDYYNSDGRFIDQHTIEAINSSGDKTYLTADNIVIAVGCRPAYPDKVSGAIQYGITSDDLFSLKEPPGKTLVVGASYVALESAGFLHGLGCPTSVMIRSKPLKGFDEQMSDLIVLHMKQEEGINIMSGCVPLSLEPLAETNQGEGNPLLVKYKYLDDHKVCTDTWDTVIFATGRKPLLSNMGLDTVGIDTSSVSGRVIVDNNDCTSLQHVFAIGDIAEGRPELTPVAIKAGKMLSDRLFGNSTNIIDYTNVPTTVFTPLELSCVGLTEKQAIEEYGDSNIEIYHAYYKPLEYYLPDRDASHCYIKVVAVKDTISCSERVLGIHITGPNTGEILQGFAVAMRSSQLTMDYIQYTIGIHPTSAEEMVKLHITKRSGLDPMVTGC